MERLSIDEVIAHCKRHTERMEGHSERSQLEETPIGNSNIMKQYWEHRQVAEWLEQLKAYKDAEEQGLLLRLPCKVGDKVYKPNPITLNEIVEINIESIFITLGRVNISGRTTIMKYTFCCSPSDFGKTIFLTKEEAEQALAEMKGCKDGRKHKILLQY